MDQPERLVESLLDSSWVSQGAELFAEELKDLEQLEDSEVKVTPHKHPHRNEHVDIADACRESCDGSAWSQDRRAVSRARRSPTLAKPRAPERSVSRASTGGFAKDTSSASPMAASVRVRSDKVVGSTGGWEHDPYRQALQALKHQVRQIREESDLRRAFARRQLRFFCARNMDEYLPVEILCGIPVRSQSRKGEISPLDFVSEDEWVRMSHQDDVASSMTPSVTESRWGATTNQTPYASSTSYPGSYDFTIDAVNFMVELNAALEEEHGVRIVTKEMPSSSEEQRPSVLLTNQLYQMLEHQPGCMMDLKKPAWCNTVLPPIVLKTEENWIDNERNDPTSVGSTVFTKKDKGDNADNAQLTFPPLQTRCNEDSGAVARAASVKKVAARSATNNCSPSKLTGVARAVAVDMDKLVHCSAVGNIVQLRTKARVKTTATVRFTNHCTRRLGMRLRSATHPWLKYSIVKVSAGKPIPASSGLCTALDRPINFFEYIDVMITFEPQTVREPLIREVLRVGYCLELNFRSGEGARWHFYDVTVVCETERPEFLLFSSKTKGGHSDEMSIVPTEVSSTVPPARRKRPQRDQVTACEFPCTFVFQPFTRCFQLENVGSDAVISLKTSSTSFKILSPEEEAIEVPGNSFVEISVCFCPLRELRYDKDQLVVTVREEREGPVLGEHTFGLRGEGALPHVSLLSIGPLDLSPCLGDNSDRVPQYFFPETAPGEEATEEVVVHNTCPIAVRYFWQISTVGGGVSGVELRISPCHGEFPPNGDVRFTVSLKSSVAEPVAAVLNLFLEGLPRPPTEMALDHDDEGCGSLGSLCSGSHVTELGASDGALRLLSRTKMIPTLPELAELRQLMDPCGAFRCVTKPQLGECNSVFVGGFYLFADPVLPCLTLIPDRFEEGLECLINGENARRVVLQNTSPRALRFILDPKPHECPPGVLFPVLYDSESVDVRFEPRIGSVPPRGSVVVTFFYTLKEVRHYSISINCYVPELFELERDCFEEPPSSPKIMEVPCTHQLFLSVTAVGPSLSVSTHLLDFGLIEQGHESEASFTVTNDNPISVVFELQDPKRCEPPRFVFLPQSFRLGVGESVEVTVYRQAVDISESQTFFEIVVQNGATIAIETRADIQVQKLVSRENVINYGVVPNGSWATESFVVSNPFASDIPYTVIAVDVPPNIMVQLPPPGVIRAGCVDVQIPVRCSFSVIDEGGSNKAVVCVKNMRTTQEILVELCCDEISELAVAVDLIPVPKGTKGMSCMAYTPPILPQTLPEAPEMSVSSYIHSLLLNLVELHVLHCRVSHRIWKESVSVSADGACTSSVLDLNIIDNSVSPVRGRGLVLHPYCPPVNLQALLPHGEPVWSELVVLRIKNFTGCHSTYSATTAQYGVNEPPPEARGGAVQTRGTLKSTAIPGLSLQRVSRSHPAKVGECGSNPQGGIHGAVHVAGNGTRPTAATRTIGRDGIDPQAIVQPTFWCRDVDGSERRERERRAALIDAQEALLDGRGCATMFGGPLAGVLDPFSESKVPLTLSANLPGRYEETLKVRCGDMAPVHIPVSLELRGRPVLLDSTTAGLLLLDGKEVLLMPSVLAGVGRSQRTLRLVNRLPRDLSVCFKIYLTNVAFSVFAEDDQVNANAVTLRLGPVTAEDHRRESEGKGLVAATPEKFYLPAMSSQLVTVEYAPDAKFVGADCSERKWLGGVVITAEYADTSFNDAFIIDEFYRLNPQYRPIDRVVKSAAPEGDAAWTKSLLRPAAMLKVRQPVITRPGIIKKSTIIVPELGTTRYVRRNRADRRESLGNSSDSFLRCHPPFSSDDDSDSGEEGGETESTGWCREDNRTQRDDASSTLAALECERVKLLSFLERRRQELVEQSRRYFIPIELELQALCGVARLTVEPSENLVQFPTCVDGQRCTQTVLLTNQSCAVMAFMLDVPSPSFKMVKTRLISSDRDYKQLEVDDEETIISRKAVESLRWCGLEERRRAQQVMAQGQNKENTNKGCSQIVLERHPTQSLCPESISRTHGGGVSVTKYQLFPHDSLQVVLEYQSHSKDERDALACQGATVTGELDILYLPADAFPSKPQQGGAAVCDKLFHPPPVLELKQTVPLSLRFSNPSVTSSPSFLWFFPGQQVHDGRKQPSYVRKLRLMSLHPSPLSFKLSLSDTASNRNLVPARCNEVLGFGSLDGPVGRLHGTTDKPTPRREKGDVFSRERKIRQMRCYLQARNVSVVGSSCGGDDGSCNEKIVRRELELRLKSREGSCAVEDASRFVITPMEGTIPAATRGGQPGVFEILVEFKEHANMRFEAAFDVLIGTHLERASSFFLRGDSRETEL